MLQSLTDIPFSVGAGCCTRFATRIVSKRTGPSTANRFKITIVEPEVRIEDFQYREDGLYKDYVQAGDALGGEEFKKIVEEVCPPTIITLGDLLTEISGLHKLHGHQKGHRY